MNDDELAAAVSADPNMRLYLYKAKSQFEAFSEARERYHHAVTQLQAKIKEVPTNLLIEISENCGRPKKTDPDLIPENKITLPDAAEREIHRRSFLSFTAGPSRKGKIDAHGLGFLRKPKF